MRIDREQAESAANRYNRARDRSWDCRQEIDGLENRLRDLKIRQNSLDENVRVFSQEFERIFAGLLVGEDEGIDGRVCRAPHCDQWVLHAPGACEFCDRYPRRQALRVELGVNFSGGQDPDKIPCPSELLRPRATVERWRGNRPKPADQS